MGIRQATLENAFEMAVIEEMVTKLLKQGYSVERNARYKGNLVDLMAIKDENKFIYEFKTRPIIGKERERIEKLSKKAKEEGFRFRVVVIPIPKKKNIEVEGIEDTILNEFINNIPDELDCLSSHTIINEVEDISINSIELKTGDHIFIDGTGTVSVDLEYGNEEDDTFSSSFPFKFSGQWSYSNGSLILDTLDSLKFDTSSFTD